MTASVRAGRASPSILLSVAETCALLGVGRTTFNKLKDTGRLKTVKVESRRMVPRNEVDRYVARLRRKAA
jgi:excisionase family DNA binding protein